jgi:hypothetical protein
MNCGEWMTHHSISACSLILLLFFAHEAAAAQHALILLDNIQQNVQTSYQLDARQIRSGSTVHQNLNESYNFDMDYGIFDPRILNGRLSTTMQFSQQYNNGSDVSSSSGSGMQFQYNFSGKLYDNSPAPLYFGSSSAINLISPEFGRDYHIVTDSYTVSTLVKNKTLPLELSYNKVLSHTIGLDQNYSTENDRFSFNASNENNSTGRTELRLLANRDITDVENVSSDIQQFSIGLTNAIVFFKSSKPLSMSNSISYSEQGGRTYSKGLSLTHGLTWTPGRALTLGLGYSFANHERDMQNDQLQKARIFLTHRLFESLETGMEIESKKNNLSTGHEDETTGMLNLKYNKQLPSASRLNIDFRQSYGVTSRAFTSGVVSEFDEPHTVDPSKLFLLQNLNALVASIVIRNADPLTHPLPYVQDVDYQITVVGSQTLISANLTGSGINAGDKLLITYNYKVNPQVRYATNSRGATSNLSLFSNKYRLYASWQELYQTFLGGAEGGGINLSGTSYYQLGMGTQFANGEFIGEYSVTNSNDDRQQALYSMIRYGGRVGADGYVLTVTDRYSIITTAAVAGSAAKDQNSNRLSLSASYNTWLLSAISCMLETMYVMERGTLSRDDVSLSMRLSWRSGKLALALVSQAFFKMTDTEHAVDEHVRFDLTRYF